MIPIRAYALVVAQSQCGVCRGQPIKDSYHWCLSPPSPFLSEVNDMFIYLMKQKPTATWVLEEMPQVMAPLGGCAGATPLAGEAGLCAASFLRARAHTEATEPQAGTSRLCC